MKLLCMADTIGELMRAWRKGEGLTQAEAAGKVKISREYWAILERSVQQPSRDVRESLDRIGIFNQQSSSDVRPVSVLFGAMASVPVVGMVSAGDGVSSVDHDETEIWVPERLANIGGIGYIVDGESMMPALQPGDIALFKENAHLRKGFTYLLKRGDSEYRVKNLIWQDNQWMAASINPDRSRYPVENLNDTQVLGVLIGWYRSIGSYEKLEADPHGLRLDYAN